MLESSTRLSCLQKGLTHTTHGISSEVSELLPLATVWIRRPSLSFHPASRMSVGEEGWYTGGKIGLEVERGLCEKESKGKKFNFPRMRHLPRLPYTKNTSRRTGRTSDKGTSNVNDTKLGITVTRPHSPLLSLPPRPSFTLK